MRGRSGRSGRRRVPAEPDTSSLVLFEQEEAGEVDEESFGSEEARWRPMEAEDLDPLSELSLGLNEMDDRRQGQCVIGIETG